MLVTEIVTIKGLEFVHNYSDSKFYIQKIGTEEIYSEAYDPIQFKDERKYIETDQKIEPEETEYINKSNDQHESCYEPCE